MNRYDTLKAEEWYQSLRKYSVVVELERRRLGAELYDIDEFHRMLENGNFRGICLNDAKFADKLIEPRFQEFLRGLRWRRKVNAVGKTIGWLMFLALVGWAGWFLWTRPLAEALPWTVEWVKKLTYKFDGGSFPNPHAVSGIVLALAAIVGGLVYAVWTYVTLFRYGFCKKCGNFVFGVYIFHVKCRCTGRIMFLS